MQLSGVMIYLLGVTVSWSLDDLEITICLLFLDLAIGLSLFFIRSLPLSMQIFVQLITYFRFYSFRNLYLVTDEHDSL
jgi:hypothetical protein